MKFLAQHNFQKPREKGLSMMVTCAYILIYIEIQKCSYFIGLFSHSGSFRDSIGTKYRKRNQRERIIIKINLTMRHFEIKKCEKKQWIVLFQSSSFTPWKINMEPPNHPFRKEKDLPNLQGIMFHVNLQGCNHQCFDFGYQEKQPVFIP